MSTICFLLISAARSGSFLRHSCWSRFHLADAHRKVNGVKFSDRQKQSSRVGYTETCNCLFHLRSAAGTSGTLAASCSWVSRSRRVSTWAKRNALAAGSTLLNFLR